MKIRIKRRGYDRWYRSSSSVSALASSAVINQNVNVNQNQKPALPPLVNEFLLCTLPRPSLPTAPAVFNNQNVNVNQNQKHDQRQLTFGLPDLRLPDLRLLNFPTPQLTDFPTSDRSTPPATQ